MKEEKLTEHYRFTNPTDPKEMARVVLTKTPYEGVEYAYGNVAPKMIDGEPIISYIFEVYVNPKNLDLDNDQNFKTLISEILHEVMTVSFR